MADTSANRKVRWGILGNARINRRFVPGVQDSGNSELVAIASRDEAKAQEGAKQWGASKAYSSYEALLADPEIDAVYIPLPNHLHAEWAIKAAQASKHVLVEKPIALTVEDVRLIEDAAKANNVLVMEAFVYIYHPQHRRVREILAEGTIGEMRTAHVTFSFVADFSKYNIRQDPAVGGGATWDVGCYAVSASRLLFGREPLSVLADGYSRPGFEVDTTVAAILDFGEGHKALLDYSFDHGRNNYYEVYGTNGRVEIETMAPEANAKAHIIITTAEGRKVEEFAPVNQFALEVSAFSQAILDGTPAPLPLSNSLENTKVLVKLLQSIQEKSVIDI